MDGRKVPKPKRKCPKCSQLLSAPFLAFHMRKKHNTAAIIHSATNKLTDAQMTIEFLKKRRDNLQYAINALDRVIQLCDV